LAIAVAETASFVEFVDIVAQLVACVVAVVIELLADFEIEVQTFGNLIDLFPTADLELDFVEAYFDLVE